MQILIDIGNAVNNVMGIFGSTIIVPIIIFIISMCMRVGVKKSFQGDRETGYLCRRQDQ